MVFNSYFSISLGSFFFIFKFFLNVIEKAKDLKFEVSEAEYSPFMLLVTSKVAEDPFENPFFDLMS